ncbi:redoxin family protein, partial [Klebsiella aerogenes]|uniref:redoxin family protein n=1 Tax=Klebsiella aerogenes TaxID=548 RepID=UPI0013D2E92F
FKAKGVDAIYATSTNDIFVLDAWQKASGAVDKVGVLADGSADFAKAIGLENDMSAFGMGMRSKRYSMLVK